MSSAAPKKRALVRYEVELGARHRAGDVPHTAGRCAHCALPRHRPGELRAAPDIRASGWTAQPSIA